MKKMIDWRSLDTITGYVFGGFVIGACTYYMWHADNQIVLAVNLAILLGIRFFILVMAIRQSKKIEKKLKNKFEETMREIFPDKEDLN